MALNDRPLRGVAILMMVLSAMLFAAGVWGQLDLGQTLPGARIISDVAAPLILGHLPGVFGNPQTVFGAFAQPAGLAALAGLLLLAPRRRQPPPFRMAPVHAAHRVMPRHATEVRAARIARSSATLALPPPGQSGAPRAANLPAVIPAAAPEPAAPQPAQAIPVRRRRIAAAYNRGAIALIVSSAVIFGASAAYGTLPPGSHARYAPAAVAVLFALAAVVALLLARRSQTPAAPDDPLRKSR